MYENIAKPTINETIFLHVASPPGLEGNTAGYDGAAVDIDKLIHYAPLKTLEERLSWRRKFVLPFVDAIAVKGLRIQQVREVTAMGDGTETSEREADIFHICLVVETFVGLWSQLMLWCRGSTVEVYSPTNTNIG